MNAFSKLKKYLKSQNMKNKNLGNVSEMLIKFETLTNLSS